MSIDALLQARVNRVNCARNPALSVSHIMQEEGGGLHFAVEGVLRRHHLDKHFYLKPGLVAALQKCIPDKKLDGRLRI